jgi:hypothetical protein
MTSSSNSIDWAKLYSPNQLTAWRLPTVNQEDEEDGIFRNLFLDWNKLPKKANSGNDIPLWFLCCDVLDLNKDIMTGTTALIFARRIEITSNASLIFDRSEGKSQDILIFAQEVVDKLTGQPTALNITTVSDNDTLKICPFQPDPNLTGASGFFWEDKAEAAKTMLPADLELAYFYEGEPLRLALVSQFQVATLLSTEPKAELQALSIDQFRWVASLAQASTETRDLSAQARSMAMTLSSMKAVGKDTLLVPQLDMDIYKEEAKAFMDLLRQRQQQWDNFQSRLAESGNWANVAQDAISTQQVQKDLVDKLVNQAESTRRQMIYARDVAARQVVAEKALIAERQIDFERGIEEWKKQQTIKAAIDLVMGIVKILSQIPTIVAAGPQMAVMPAIETASGFAQSAVKVISSAMSSDKKPVKEIEMQDLTADGKPIKDAPADKDKLADFLDKQAQKEREDAQNTLKEGLNTAGEGGKEVFDAAMRIAEIAQAAEQMESQSLEILNSVNNTTSTAFSSYDVQGLDVVTGGEQVWDLLLIAVENTFENISALKEVEGGVAYRLEIRRLVIYGKALSKARLALAQANTQLAEMKWRYIAAEQMTAIAERRLKMLQAQILQDQTFAQLIFGRLLDAKRSIYLAMEDYRRAFQYFTLVEETQAPALPRITDSVDKFASAVAAISGKKLKLEALGQPPQSMKRTIYLDSLELLNQVRSNGFFTWEISPDTLAFRGFGRIRLKCVRVYAEGLQTSDDVRVQMVTSGIYTDKVSGGGTRRFVSKNTRRDFVYNGSTQEIGFDGDIAPRYVDDFFSPTPFTIWTLQIGPQDGRAIDLSSITSLRMEFQGEATLL